MAASNHELQTHLKTIFSNMIWKGLRLPDLSSSSDYLSPCIAPAEWLRKHHFLCDSIEISLDRKNEFKFFDDPEIVEETEKLKSLDDMINDNISTLRITFMDSGLNCKHDMLTHVATRCTKVRRLRIDLSYGRMSAEMLARILNAAADIETLSAGSFSHESNETIPGIPLRHLHTVKISSNVLKIPNLLRRSICWHRLKTLKISGFADYDKNQLSLNEIKLCINLETFEYCGRTRMVESDVNTEELIHVLSNLVNLKHLELWIESIPPAAVSAFGMLLDRLESIRLHIGSESFSSDGLRDYGCRLKILSYSQHDENFHFEQLMQGKTQLTSLQIKNNIEDPLKLLPFLTKSLLTLTMTTGGTFPQSFPESLFDHCPKLQSLELLKITMSVSDVDRVFLYGRRLRKVKLNGNNIIEDEYQFDRSLVRCAANHSLREFEVVMDYPCPLSLCMILMKYCRRLCTLKLSLGSLAISQYAESDLKWCVENEIKLDVNLLDILHNASILFVIPVLKLIQPKTLDLSCFEVYIDELMQVIPYIPKGTNVRPSNCENLSDDQIKAVLKTYKDPFATKMLKLIVDFWAGDFDDDGESNDVADNDDDQSSEESHSQSNEESDGESNQVVDEDYNEDSTQNLQLTM